MIVKEFFEQIAPLIEIHDFNKSNNKTLRIKIWDGGGLYGNQFCACGDISSCPNLYYYELTKPFNNTYWGKKEGKDNCKTISVFDMKVREWEIFQDKKDSNLYYLVIEVDNNIK